MQFWIGALILYLAVAITPNRFVQICAFVLAGVLVWLTNERLYPEADLAWYRSAYNAIHPGNLQTFIESNDYEAFIFVVFALEKAVFGIGIGFCLFLLLTMPILNSKCRHHIEFLALFMLYPGSFLLFNNVIRQGFSEWFLVLGIITGVYATGGFALLSHRFGFFPYAYGVLLKNDWVPHWSKNAFLAAFVTYLILGNGFTADAGDAYANLQSSWGNFSLKLVSVLFPFAFTLVQHRIYKLKDSDFEWMKTVTIFIVVLSILSILLAPRLADRIILFAIPFSLGYFHFVVSSKFMRILFASTVFLFSLGSLALPSHVDFFIYSY
jgi:hypothetical protein